MPNMGNALKNLVLLAGGVGVGFGLLVIVSYVLIGDTSGNVSPLDAISAGFNKLGATANDNTEASTETTGVEPKPVDQEPKPQDQGQANVVQAVETSKPQRDTWTIDDVIADAFDLTPGEQRAYTIKTENTDFATLTGTATVTGQAFQGPLKLKVDNGSCSGVCFNTQEIYRDTNKINIKLYPGATQKIIISNPRTDIVSVNIHANIEYVNTGTVAENADMHAKADPATQKTAIGITERQTP